MWRNAGKNNEKNNLTILRYFQRSENMCDIKKEMILISINISLFLSLYENFIKLHVKNRLIFINFDYIRGINLNPFPKTDM